MHPRDLVILQTAATAGVLILAYITFILPRHSGAASSARKRHTTPRIIPRQHGDDHHRALNITEIIGCEAADMPSIHICVFARDAARVRRLVRTLSSAAYSPAPAVNLTVIGHGEEIAQQMPLLNTMWPHSSEFRLVNQSLSDAAVSDGPTLVIALDDGMEPSPLHALWFLIQHCRTNASAIAGGGSSIDTAVGLAVGAVVWEGFIGWADDNNIAAANGSTALLANYISQLSLPNASVIFPATAGGESYAFVREEWQNPAYVEHAPRLARAWNPAKEPSWGAVEVQI